MVTITVGVSNMATVKNAVKDADVVETELPENPFANWEEEQLGFPPYIKAEVKKGYFCRVITADTRDPDFVRFVLQYLGMPSNFDKLGQSKLDITKPLMCKRGPKEDAEEVAVKVGEFFTVSNYVGLPLENYLGVEAVVDVTGMRKTSQPNDMFVFRIQLSPENKALIQGRRAQELREMKVVRSRERLAQNAANA